MKIYKNLKKGFREYIGISKIIFPTRAIILPLILLLGIPISKMLVNMFVNEKLKEVYFWILSSLVQGFSAFFGIMIALLTIEFARGGYSKDSLIILKLYKLYSLPLILSTLTIMFSIMGMLFYPIISNQSLIIFIFVSSSFAIWSIFEILFITIKWVVNI